MKPSANTLLNKIIMRIGKTTFHFSISIAFLALLLFIYYIISFSRYAKPNLYYIDEIGVYIKTFPSKDYSIIAFSDNKINVFSDSLNYIIVNRGINYGTCLLFDPQRRDTIYDTGSNSIYEVHLKKYSLHRIFYSDTLYYKYKGKGEHTLNFPYISISLSSYGTTEDLYIRAWNDNIDRKMKPLK